MASGEASVARSERLWAVGMVALAAVMLVVIVHGALALHLNPPSNIETIDPATIHLTGEFADDNLGTSVESSGEVTARIVATQFSFQPSCVVVPQGIPVTLRMVAPDVIHGIIIVGTNINTMIVPGYVSRVRTTFRETGEMLMPCHEFCGLGHSEMAAHVRVVPQSEFKPDESGRVTCAQR
jgi:cytochrome c oxidase subunit II